MCCNKNYWKKFHEDLKKRLANTYKYFNHETNKFVLLLQKGVYPYEYMDDCDKFNEASLREEKYLYSYLNMEDNIGSNCMHAKRVS